MKTAFPHPKIKRIDTAISLNKMPSPTTMFPQIEVLVQAPSCLVRIPTERGRRAANQPLSRQPSGPEAQTPHGCAEAKPLQSCTAGNQVSQRPNLKHPEMEGWNANTDCCGCRNVRSARIEFERGPNWPMAHRETRETSIGRRSHHCSFDSLALTRSGPSVSPAALAVHKVMHSPFWGADGLP